jgi:hypothetical protein
MSSVPELQHLDIVKLVQTSTNQYNTQTLRKMQNYEECFTTKAMVHQQSWLQCFYSKVQCMRDWRYNSLEKVKR